MKHSSFEVTGNYTTGIIKILCVSEQRWKSQVTSLEPTSSQRPTTFTPCTFILHLSILYFLCYHICLQPLSFSFLCKASYNCSAKKINHTCKVTDLVQSFGFYTLHQEQLFPVYASNSEADPWNILLNSLEKPMDLINCLYMVALHMLKVQNSLFWFLKQ